MSAGNWFWIIYVMIGLFGGWFGFFRGEPVSRPYIGGGVVFYVLLGLLGWGLFGAPLK